MFLMLILRSLKVHVFYSFLFFLPLSKERKKPQLYLLTGKKTMALLLPPVSAGTTPGPETVCPPRDRSCRHGEKWLWSVQGSIGPIRGSSSAPDPAVGSPFCGGPDVVAGGGVWVVWWYWVTPGPAPGPPPVPEGHSASVHLLTDIAGQVIGWAATLSLAHPLHPPRTQAPGVASAYRTGPTPWTAAAAGHQPSPTPTPSPWHRAAGSPPESTLLVSFLPAPPSSLSNPSALEHRIHKHPKDLPTTLILGGLSGAHPAKRDSTQGSLPSLHGPNPCRAQGQMDTGSPVLKM